ncbi:eugenol synthase 1 [Quercus suber]|uniref:Eugenol synthase 1 n=1 Tax=Quercus suber TaxID=58331 RepID=A0AAW0KRL2_QUESU
MALAKKSKILTFGGTGIFVKGETMSFELGEDDIEASSLCRDFEYTTIDQLLDIFLINSPKPTIVAFE